MPIESIQRTDTPKYVWYFCTDNWFVKEGLWLTTTDSHPHGIKPKPSVGLVLNDLQLVLVNLNIYRASFEHS